MSEPIPASPSSPSSVPAPASAPSTQWRERIEEGEDPRLAELARELHALQARRTKAGRVGRGLHFKAHLAAAATFEVLSDLPPHAKQGLFAAPRTYRSYVRFSNGSGRAQPDRTGDIRGIAIKVLGVPGKKIIPGLEGATTQDFLLIHTPTSPFRNAEEFVALVVAGAGHPLLLLPRLIARIGAGRALGIVRRLVAALKPPFRSFATAPYFSVLPIQWGPYAARLALRPRGAEAPRPDAPSLADDLAARLKDGGLAWDLCAQFFVDEARTPIEDPSVDWAESDSPWVPVARLTIAAHDARAEAAKQLEAHLETLSFDPWHALVEHRPLGEMMRARNHAYRLSTQERGAAPEPSADDAP